MAGYLISIRTGPSLPQVDGASINTYGYIEDEDQPGKPGGMILQEGIFPAPGAAVPGSGTVQRFAFNQTHADISGYRRLLYLGTTNTFSTRSASMAGTGTPSSPEIVLIDEYATNDGDVQGYYCAGNVQNFRIEAKHDDLTGRVAKVLLRIYDLTAPSGGTETLLAEIYTDALTTSFANYNVSGAIPSSGDITLGRYYVIKYYGVDYGIPL